MPNVKPDTSLFWLDIGEYGEYQKANEEFEKRKKEFLPDNEH